MSVTTSAVTAGTASHTTTYAYDAVGNRVQKADPSGTTTYTYDAADRLTQVAGPDGTRSYTWDARGNQLADGQFQYSYDSLNRLTSVNTGTQTVTYAYDGDGLLFSRTAGGETTRFYLNGPNVINEGDGTGTITAAMLAAGGTYAGRQVGAGPAAYYLYNGHGDVIGVVSSGGTLASYDYDAFGNLTTQSGSFDNPYLYAGEYYDFTAGLYNLRARFYSPALGRFTAEDTWQGDILNPVTLNLYVYALNNPLLYVDPSGHISNKVGIDGGGGPPVCYELTCELQYADATVIAQGTQANGQRYVVYETNLADAEGRPIIYADVSARPVSERSQFCQNNPSDVDCAGLAGYLEVLVYAGKSDVMIGFYPLDPLLQQLRELSAQVILAATLMFGNRSNSYSLGSYGGTKQVVGYRANGEPVYAVSGGAGDRVPQKAMEVLHHIETRGAAPRGYKGGGSFENKGSRLPPTDAHGNPISYRKWDIDPKVPGVGRSPERLVTGSDGSVYYTPDHYETFIRIR